jgi:hypothetical protein
MYEKAEARLAEMRDKAGLFSEAQAQKNYLEKYRESLLAILMKEYEVLGFKTAAAQDREARADKRYLQNLLDLRTATENSEKLKWEMEILKLSVGVWQTINANERAERRGYGA